MAFKAWLSHPLFFVCISLVDNNTAKTFIASVFSQVCVKVRDVWAAFDQLKLKFAPLDPILLPWQLI